MIGQLAALHYDSPKQAPLVSVIHPGNHKYPEQASEMIVKFFKQHQLVKPSEQPKP